jgi:hypothetical protein
MRAPHVLVLAVLATFAACAFPLQLPKEFVELRDRGDGHRAVTADDARLRVRDLPEATEGSVDFWADTLGNDCVQQRGYELVERGEVKDRDGVAGRWLQFSANVAGEKTGVLVALWVRTRTFGNSYLQVAEFAARHDVFTARLPAVKQALATLRP